MKKTYISPSVKVYAMNMQPMLAGSGDATQVTETPCTDLTQADSRDSGNNLWEDDEDGD